MVLCCPSYMRRIHQSKYHSLDLTFVCFTTLECPPIGTKVFSRHVSAVPKKPLENPKKVAMQSALHSGDCSSVENILEILKTVFPFCQMNQGRRERYGNRFNRRWYIAPFSRFVWQYL